MLAITLLICSLAAVKVGQWLIIVFVDVLATAIAAQYYWRSVHTGRKFLADRPAIDTPADTAWDRPTRRRRRLMARHLRLSVAMTAHYSLFPRSSARGYALVEMVSGPTQITA